MNEIIELKDMLRYVKYDTETALVILTNDVLNIHLRPASIGDLSVTTTTDNTTVTIDLIKDPDILADGGKYYTGTVTVTFDKINIATVYPGGFLIPRWMGLESLLETLKSVTGVQINKEDCHISTNGDIRTLEILPESLFWYGSLVVKITESLMVIEVDIVPSPNIDTILDGTTLDGFTVDDNTENLNKDLFDTIAFLSAIYHNKTSN